MPETNDIPRPSTMGRYRLMRRLAVGGMAEIFLARTSTVDGFEKAVVVKRILPQHAGDGELVRMFLDEARLAAGLHHVNIAGVYDFGREGAWPFYTMEYVHGLDLGQLWKAAARTGQPVPLQHALTIVTGVAAGLHHAHEQRDDAGAPLGIVHRDVTPSNVLIGYDGSVKLSDFGIAKMRHARHETAPGAVRGKLSYMSPEQLGRGAVDRRSDIFSLGVLLYELGTGLLLYDEPAEAELFRLRLAGELAPPAPRSPHYPADLAQVVSTCLARDPAGRFATARELQQALEALAQSRSLALSPLALADYVAALAPDDVARWRRAERAGTALVDFVAPGAEPATAELRAILADRGTASELNRNEEEGPRTLALGPAAPRSRGSRRLWWAALPAAALAVLGLSLVKGPPAPHPGARTLWAGAWHTCALDEGSVHCWGKNNEGQLGIGTTIDRSVPGQLPGLTDLASFSAGYFHGCACTAAGRAFCWGRNDDRQLGQGTLAGVQVPVAVPGLDDCVQISAGLGHSCALRGDGSVACWGRNDHGQTGRPASFTFAREPSPVPLVRGALQVATGGQLLPDEAGGFTCSVVADGRILCFGDNQHGQLGDGTTRSRHTPAAVRGLTDARQVSLGGSFACARRGSGGLICWGRNLDGALPGPPGARPHPVDIPGLGDVVALATGLGHVCAARSNGTLWCWGQNNHGQLGDGGRRSRPEPAPVPGLEGVTEVVAGDVHSCARHRNGVSCWGANQTGQLGDATTKQKLAPVSVAGLAR